MKISLNDVLNDLHSDNPKYPGYYFDKFKKFVAATARGTRRKRILQKPWYGIERCGILGRLRIDTETEKVEYIVGQYRPDEEKILRGIFD